MRKLIARFWRTTQDYRAILFYQFQLWRLTADRVFHLLPPRKERPRVAATACWHFPIYSQTFVYQELIQLMRSGAALRFFYSQLNPREHLPPQFSQLWHARCRLHFHPSVCQQAYEYYRSRIPDKVSRMTELLAGASGITPDALRQHRHYTQAFAFTRMIEAYRPDYIHSYFFYEGTLFTFVASYLLDIPRGVSCYADHVLKDYELKVVALHLGQCAITVATSSRIKEELLRLASQVHPEQILVKPNAINIEHFPFVNRDSIAGVRPFRLVCVSRIEPKKGLIYLVEAVRQLRDRGIPVEAHLLGGIDNNPTSKDYALQLERRIQELGLEGIVNLAGRRTEMEIRKVFENSHVFVAPFVETASGDKDGIPTSLLEGMSSGLPVVATNAGSILEVISDGHDGIVVPQRDPLALADAVASLFANPERRGRLAQEGAKTISRRFDVHVCERIFHERVRSVANRCKATNI